MGKIFNTLNLLTIQSKLQIFSIIFATNLIELLPTVHISMMKIGKYLKGAVLSDLIFPVLVSLANISWFNFKCLVDIEGIDFPDSESRLFVSYALLSHTYDQRLFIMTPTFDFAWISTITPLFMGADWPEREVWDMFGIGFLNHPDLRRILTDYGFKGHPLRRNFPFVGFLEVQYNNLTRYIEYVRVSLSALPRQFATTNNVNISFN